MALDEVKYNTISFEKCCISKSKLSQTNANADILINPQRVSMAIQRGNASCVLGTVPRSEGLEKIFDFETVDP